MNNEKHECDPVLRFSNRVDDYVRYRPGYPDDVLTVLEKFADLTADSVIADIGSGTGISSELFLRNGNQVYAVEPNDPMRKAAEKQLGDYPGFHSISGSAEATTLPGGCIDFVVAAQAFHWFRPDETKREFLRILKPGGKLVLMWNARRTKSTEFLRAYESFLKEYGTDYRSVNHRNLNEMWLRSYFKSCRKKKLFNEQVLDYAGLQGRVLSSSYIPAPDDPGYHPMLQELKRIFMKYNNEGYVRIEYDTELFFGEIAGLATVPPPLDQGKGTHSSGELSASRCSPP